MNFTSIEKNFPGGSDGKEFTCRRRPEFNLVMKILWRREWLLTPVFLTGEFHGQRSLEGYNLWGHRESDTTEVTEHARMQDSVIHCESE